MALKVDLHNEKEKATAVEIVSGFAGSAEHTIEQELQNDPEGANACAFQTALPSNPDSTVNEGNKPAYEAGWEKDEHRKAVSEDVSAMLAGRVPFRFDLELQQELGSGAYGTIYHGKWRGKDVAINRINNTVFLVGLSKKPDPVQPYPNRRGPARNIRAFSVRVSRSLSKSSKCRPFPLFRVGPGFFGSPTRDLKKTPSNDAKAAWWERVVRALLLGPIYKDREEDRPAPPL